MADTENFSMALRSSDESAIRSRLHYPSAQKQDLRMARITIRLDELHATAIQTLAILAKSIGARTPDILAAGLADARRLLKERGLLDPEQDRP